MSDDITNGTSFEEVISVPSFLTGGVSSEETISVPAFLSDSYSLSPSARCVGCQSSCEDEMWECDDCQWACQGCQTCQGCQSSCEDEQWDCSGCESGCQGCQTACEDEQDDCVGCESGCQYCQSSCEDEMDDCSISCQTTCEWNCQGCQSNCEDEQDDCNLSCQTNCEFECQNNEGGCVTCQSECEDEQWDPPCEDENECEEAPCELEEDPCQENGQIQVDRWDWTSTTARAKAYAAITSQGPVKDFSYTVWNELVDLVYDVRGYSEIDPQWDGYYASFSATRMSSTSKVLTATRFNSLWRNINYLWATGITTQTKGDIVYGSYFISLTTALNKYIDSM